MLFHGLGQITLQPLQDLPLSSRKVTLFSSVVMEIVKFWLLPRIILNQLPLSCPYSLFATELPVEILVAFLLPAPERIHKRNAVNSL